MKFLGAGYRIRVHELGCLDFVRPAPEVLKATLMNLYVFVSVVDSVPKLEVFRQAEEKMYTFCVPDIPYHLSVFLSLEQ